MMRWILVFFFLFQASSVLADNASLKRGAHVFNNYCSGCHALRYLRDTRLVHDLSLNAADGHMDFTQVSMPITDARRWFGKVPPDLSLTARVRGTSWLVAYLKGFYPDSCRPFGVNNRLFPMVAMPNVLAPMGDQAALDDTVQDVVAFLEYVAEPARLVRYRMGVGVMIFLCVLGGLVYSCKRYFE